MKANLFTENTFKRIISAAILIPLTLGILLYGSSELFLVLIVAVALGGFYEYFHLIRNMGIEGFPLTGGVLCVLFLLCFYLNDYFLLWLFLAIFSLFITWINSFKSTRDGLDPLGYTFFGVVFVAGLMGYFLLIRDQPQGPQIILFLFLIIWLSDTAAFFVGKTLGATALVPNISPGKTVEGAIGGIGGSLLAGILSNLWFLKGISITHCLIMSLLCGIIGQIGDIAESLLKRSAGVKDSGTLIPGHGGILDRLDSLMFAGPALYCYQKLFF